MEWIQYIQGYPLVVISTFMVGAAIPFPSGLLLAWSGFILGRDMDDLALAIGLGVVGYMVGSIIPYLIGRIGGRPVIEKAFRQFHLPVSRIDQAEKWFDKHGLLVVTVSRPFFLGNYISFVAGMARTRPVPFLLCTGLGIIPWVFLYLYLGMAFGKNWHLVVGLISRYTAIVIVAALFIVLLYFAFKGRLLHIR